MDTGHHIIYLPVICRVVVDRNRPKIIVNNYNKSIIYLFSTYSRQPETYEKHIKFHVTYLCHLVVLSLDLATDAPSLATVAPSVATDAPSLATDAPSLATVAPSLAPISDAAILVHVPDAIPDSPTPVVCLVLL